MKRRFDDVNTSLMKSMQALHPESDKFLNLETLRPFMSHYDIDADDVEVELMTAKRLLLNCTGNLNFIMSMSNCYKFLRDSPCYGDV